MAAAFGEPARGDELVARLEARLARMHAETSAMPRRPSIACIEWIDLLMLAGNWVPELVDYADGVDPLGEAGKHSGYLDIAQLVAADPDVIAIMPCGFDIERAWREMPALVGRPEWQQLSAVRSGRVVMTDGNHYFNRPRTAAGGIGGDPGRVPASGALRLRAPRSRMAILGGDQ